MIIAHESLSGFLQVTRGKVQALYYSERNDFTGSVNAALMA